MTNRNQRELFVLRLYGSAFMFFVNANFANSQIRHLLRQTIEILAELHVRMRVGRGCKWNPLPHREFNDSIARIKFVYRFAPTSGGKFNRKIAQANEVERFTDDCVHLHMRSMTMDFDEIQMGEAIDQPSRCYFADTAKVIGVNCSNIASVELLGASRDTVEHLVVAIEEMDGSQNKIEFVPMLLDPFSPRRRVYWIVVQLDARANFEIEIFLAQTIDFIENDSGVITIVIGESDVA